MQGNGTNNIRKQPIDFAVQALFENFGILDDTEEDLNSGNAVGGGTCGHKQSQFRYVQEMLKRALSKKETNGNPDFSEIQKISQMFRGLSKGFYKTEQFHILESLTELEEIYNYSEYSNKVLIADENMVEIVKTKLGLDNVSNVLFVLNKSTVKKINKQEYHLDDLQYDVAKAIGTEPEKLKLLYLTKQMNNLKKTNYTNLELTQMLEPPTSPESIIFKRNPIKFITVEVDADVEQFENILLIVAVHDFTYGSQWLGGYIDNKTNIYYHNASTQTDPSRRKFSLPWLMPPECISRDSQTHLPYKDRGMNLPIDHSTQMWRYDYYMPADTDLILSPRHYIPFDVKYGPEARERAAVVIQKYWKDHKRKMHIKELAKFTIEQEEVVLKNVRRSFYWKEDSDIIIDKGKMSPTEHIPDIISNIPNQLDDKFQATFNWQILNIMFPFRRKDFYKLHYLINKYKADNIKKLKSIGDRSYRKAEIYNFLEKANQILQSIEKQSVLIKKEILLRIGKKMLEHSSAPQLKPNFDKNTVHVINKYGIEQCRQFKELYILFLREDLTIEQRIETLLLFKKLLQNYKYFEMKDDLLELMDRECILLSNGIPSKYLDSHRKRMQEILNHFIEITEGYLIPERRALNKEIYRCKSCGKFKNAKHFPIDNRHKFLIKCKTCLYIGLAPHTKEDIPYYSDILAQIQTDEYRRGCRNPYASLLQPKGVQFIIKNIWGGKSVLSNTSHLPYLTLSRWDNRKPWAPWNCILLTTEEANFHERIENVYEFYIENFCCIIKNKNLKGLLKFHKLAESERIKRKTWFCLPDTAFYAGTETLLNAFLLTGNGFFFASNKKIIF